MKDGLRSEEEEEEEDDKEEDVAWGRKLLDRSWMVRISAAL